MCHARVPACAVAASARACARVARRARLDRPTRMVASAHALALSDRRLPPPRAAPSQPSRPEPPIARDRSRPSRRRRRPSRTGAAASARAAGARPIESRSASRRPTVKLVSPGKGKKRGARATRRRPAPSSRSSSRSTSRASRRAPTAATIAADDRARSATPRSRRSTRTAPRRTRSRSPAPTTRATRRARSVPPTVQAGGRRARRADDQRHASAANGTRGDVTLARRQRDQRPPSALDAAPRRPCRGGRCCRPSAIGVGAKWQVDDRRAKLADRARRHADHRLRAGRRTRARRWTIKGTTKVAGTDQDDRGREDHRHRRHRHERGDDRRRRAVPDDASRRSRPSSRSTSEGAADPAHVGPQIYRAQGQAATITAK